jgi:hypothetical protein
MSRYPAPIIRRIQWGLTMAEGNFVVQIGGPVRSASKTYKVSEILEDKDTFIEYGHFEYLVFASLDGKTENQFLWQRYIKSPDKIEYFTTDEIEEFGL